MFPILCPQRFSDDEAIYKCLYVRDGHTIRVKSSAAIKPLLKERGINKHKRFQDVGRNAVKNKVGTSFIRRYNLEGVSKSAANARGMTLLQAPVASAWCKPLMCLYRQKPSIFVKPTQINVRCCEMLYEGDVNFNMLTYRTGFL